MSEARSNAILIITSVLLGVSLVTVCLRCYVRLKIVKVFGWDDLLMAVAMVSQKTRSWANVPPYKLTRLNRSSTPDSPYAEF